MYEEEEEENNPKWDFHCEFNSGTGVFLKLLESIVWKKNQTAMVTATGAGIKFVIDHDEVMQADIQVHAKEMCDVFDFTDGVSSVQFCVDLKRLSKILNSSDENASVQLAFFKEDMQLMILLSEANGAFVTQATINCMEPVDAMELQFKQQPLLTSMTFNPEALKEIFSEVEVFGDKDSLVALKVTADQMEWEVTADLGVFHGAIPIETDGDVVIETNHKEDCEFFYLLNLLRPALKAVGKATTTQIQVNLSGQIKILHRLGNNRMQFIAAPRSDWEY